MSFMSLYRKTRNIVLSLIAEQYSNEIIPNVNKYNNFKNLKLPKVKIPTFSSLFTNWISFKGLYISFIHNNADLDNETEHHFSTF